MYDIIYKGDVMKLYNTLTKKKEEFVPVEPGKVKMYDVGTYWYDRSEFPFFFAYCVSNSTL